MLLSVLLALMCFLAGFVTLFAAEVTRRMEKRVLSRMLWVVSAGFFALIIVTVVA